jgi:hypothetical protein
LAGLAALSWACTADVESGPLGGAPAASGGTNAGGSGAVAGSDRGRLNPLGRERCRAPDGTSASPQSTEQAVQLLNALPKPTTVACFVESLSRPLSVYATSSPFSAQPARSVISPRVFINIGSLWISVVIAGSSSYLMEFGEGVAGEQERSTKGELLLPLAEAVAPSAPYDRIRDNPGTACGLCHYDERHEDSLPFANAFSSVAFRPRPESRVTLEALRLQNQLCDWQLEAERCEMLAALFDGGEVTETAFPAAMPTFF